MFKRTTAINKIRLIKKRIKVIQGGTSSGKTYAIIPILIDRAAKEDRLKITVVAETLPAVKEGAMDIFKTVMEDTGRWVERNWNASTLTYTFTKTKSRIQFKSFDSEGKAKASGKRDVLFLNEANHISFAIADALMIRSKETYIDYNPDNEFWVHVEVIPQPNAEFLLLTYHDNEGLPRETLEDLLLKKSKAFYDINVPDEDLFKEGNVKNTYWANWWKVYGLGQIGSLEGVIFNNWSIVNEIPEGAELLGVGIDFGYTNDPTSIAALYKFNNAYYWDEVAYQKGSSNKAIANILKQNGFDKKTKIIADSAEPKSIAEINEYGFNIKGAEKGKDSINFGIEVLQQDDFFITSRSTNAIKELRKYAWDKDKSGNVLNAPIDSFNHFIDAMRYIAMACISKVKSKKRKWGKTSTV